MMVNVKVESNLKVKNLFEPPFSLKLNEGENSLLGLLKKLATMYPYLRFTERGEMGDDLRHIYINGVSHFNLTEGLMKKIDDGDTVFVETYMDPLAGG